MLQQLTIRNFAIIDRLDIAWRPGLNAITGETGAGKSIIVDAVGALLGDRLGPEVVRSGAERALVEGVFVLPDQPPLELSAVLDEYGLEPEEGSLIVSREIASAGGRGGARVNGRTIPLAMLQQLGEQLVEVHGQSQHMALMRVKEHLEFLDRFAGVLPERTRVADLVRQLRAAREEIASLRAEERQAVRQHEMFVHEVAEIERAELREDDEEEELQAQRTRLQHVERLRQAALTAYQALHGAEGAGEIEQPGAVDLLGQAVASCLEGSRYDAVLGAEGENLNGALAVAEEAARSLRSYLDALEADPEALQRVEERLLTIAELKRKYGATVREVLDYLETTRQRVAAFERRDERLAELTDRERCLLDETSAAARSLSAARRAASERLAAAVEGELADLQMRGARFQVAVWQEDAPDGIPWDDGHSVACDLSGADRVEFLVSLNAGQEPRPMVRVASGGELARIALALKAILARADTRSTLIFDEVDVGVGGRTAPVVGEKLWALAAAGHQVLCVTHMPQVAAYADHHWVVAKNAADGQTHTAITSIDAEARVGELAAMLAGSTSTSSRQSARELLKRAATFKDTSTKRNGVSESPPAEVAAPRLL